MPTLKEALDTIAEYCRRHDCGDCVFVKRKVFMSQMAEEIIPFCLLNQESPEDYDKIPIVETNMYDKEEIHENCTVQLLKNSITGEVSVGWWKNE